MLAGTFVTLKCTSCRPMSNSTAWIIVLQNIDNLTVFELCLDINETKSIRQIRPIQSFVEKGRVIVYISVSAGGCLK